MCLEQPSITIIEDIEAISAFSCPYMLDAYRILKQLDDSGFVVFEVTVAYLLTQSII